MSRKLLLAEDDKTLMEVLTTKLDKEGFEVIPATNGKDALRILEQQPIDLVLLDVMMPVMGGFEVVDAMKEDPQLAHIPIIIISNSGQPVEINRAIRMGVQDYLIKAEFDPMEVIEKVHKHLRPVL